MKKSIAILLVLVAFQSFAQDTLSLNIDNPEPRVGDPVTLTLDIEFLTEEIKTQLADDVQMHGNFSAYSYDADVLKRVLKFNKTGKQYIGPFNFEFNGKKYVTDSIEVNVAEKLPFREGVWVRYVQANGKKYIILEQLIENKSDAKRSKNGYSYTVGGTKSSRAEFADIEAMPEKGVSIRMNSSSSYTVQPEGADPSSAGFSYSFKKYEVSMGSSSDAVYVLKSSHFNNLPRKTKIEPIEIKN